MQWSVFRDRVRASVLKDPDEDNWDNDMLKDYVGWALDDFVAHTALSKEVSFTCNGTLKQFAMPDDMYVRADVAGMVTLETTSSINYLTPILFSGAEADLRTQQGFYLWPEDTLNCVVAPATGQTLKVKYFAYYPHPEDDADEIALPSWGYTAVAYGIAAHAMSNQAVQEAMLSQYDTKRDSGRPDTLAIKTVQEWWVKMYERTLAQHQRQTRTFFAGKRL